MPNVLVQLDCLIPKAYCALTCCCHLARI